MTIAGLNLPLDVPWERICVSGDMLEAAVCSEDHLPKWRSSLAVWRYVPEDEFQIYPGRKIVYLKVTATITSYQPRDKEIEGRFRGTPKLRPIVDSILDSFLPCTNAILQVTVGPHSDEQVALTDYPYFMDFQPKKRELYEMATDTQERMSRSLEETKMGKAGGTTQSQEILDVDQGGSSGASAGVSYAGFGVNGSMSSSNQGQWGSKRLSSDQLSVTRGSDESRERRETQSHTTQISQMYNLLDSYHLGTNRAVFLLSSRPHVLDNGSVLVKGPRPLDGIQEFFLVVNQRRDQEHLCVSARLDTGHEQTIPKLDYERRSAPPLACRTQFTVPTPEDTRGPDHLLAVMEDGERVGTKYYICFHKNDRQSISYPAPKDFIIEGWNDIEDTSKYGHSEVAITSSGGTITVTCEATSRQCFISGTSGDADMDPLTTSKTAGGLWGSSVREIEPLLRSVTKTQVVGWDKALLLTTRGVCCCTDGTELVRSGVLGVGLLDILVASPKNASSEPQPKARAKRAARGGSEAGLGEAIGALSLSAPERDGATMTAREANEHAVRLREGLLRLHTAATAPAVPYVETDLFIHQLHQQLLLHPESRAELDKSLGALLRGKERKTISEHLEREEGAFDRNRLVAMSTELLAQKAGVDASVVRRLKLEALGFSFSAPRGAGSGSSEPTGT